MSGDWGAKMGGPHAVHASRFAEELGELGYSKSAAKKQMQLTAQLSRWLETEGFSVLELTADLAEPLLVTRRNEGRPNLVTTRSLKPLIGFLRRAGLPEPSKPESIDPTDLMVNRFCLYLVRGRGLAGGTIHSDS